MATLLKRKASNKNGAVRYAVAGLGYFAQAAILPAFEHAAENSALCALISDDPAKLEQLGKKYLENKNPEPSGMEGLADVRTIRALLQSAEKGKPVRVEPFERKRKRPTLALVLALPFLVYAQKA